MAQSLRELLREEQDRLEQEHADRLASVPERTVTWLALAPVWTVDLAARVGVDSGGAALSSLVEEGLCVRGSSALDGPLGKDSGLSERYWIQPETRAGVLLSAKERLGRTGLVAEINEVARRILAAQRDGTAVPPLTQRWAELGIRADGIAGAAGALDAHVEALLAEEDSGSALRWIEAALALEEVLGGELSLAVARGGRRLELFHRRRHDRRHLGQFLERDEQLVAFTQLIIGPDGEWALHFLGAGGVGKTMMMRYISAEAVPGLGGSSARVDFDYLNPDYPGRAPALLLASLAEELALHDRSGKAGRLFTRFSAKRSALEERLRDAPLVARQAESTLDSLEFDDVLRSFADAVHELPRPVVLLLDTCEELARIRADGTVPANVQATFRILEQLHEHAPYVRVVFGGRRPLASAGAGWTTDSALAVRPYLRLHEIRGFTRDEATRLLREKMEVPAELLEPILERCLDTRAPGRFRWESSVEAPPEVERFSPFDLKLYADWAREDPAVTAEAIRTADTDRYVEMRIVGRLQHPAVRRLLPAVALLGRFDRDTLAATSDVDPATLGAVIEEIGNQEWAERQPNEFLEVDRGLRPRLLEYCRRRLPGELERARQAAAAHLRRITLERDLSRLDLSHFEACLRLLEPDPVAATEWWRAVEERFAREQAYDWARGMLYRVVDQGPSVAAEVRGRIQPLDRALMASVLATYAATLVHSSPQADLDLLWAEVEEASAEHPVASERERLRLRALAGRVAGACWAGREPAPADLETLLAIRTWPLGADQELVGSVTAALEALIERAEAGWPLPYAVLAAAAELASLLQGVSPGGVAQYALVIRLRARALCENLDSEELRGIMHRLSPLHTPAREQLWLDWRAPDDLGSRNLLELVRLAIGRLPPEQVLGAATGAPIPPEITIDSERLFSALLRVHRMVRPMAPEESEALEVMLGDGAAFEASCAAHRAFSPLLMVYAEEEAGIGRVGVALDRLQSGSRVTEQASASMQTVQEADLIAARIIRRMRLQDEGRRISMLPDALETAETCWFLEGLDGPRNAALADAGAIDASLAGRRDPEWLHLRWRTLYGLSPRRAEAAVAWAVSAQAPAQAPVQGGAEATYGAVAWALDQLEANALATRHHAPPPFPGATQTSILASAGSGPDRDPEAAWRLAVRAAALGQEPVPALAATIAWLGPRRAAEIEFDEAEALALRLPALARPLFADARVRFDGCGDRVGALLCAISEALTLVRSGDREGVAELVERTIPRLFERLGGILPAFSRIERIAAEGKPEDLAGIAPLEWRPWLVRLDTCIVWKLRRQLVTAERPTTAGGKNNAAMLQSWLESTYGWSSPTGAALPAELDGLLALPARRRQRLVRRRSRRFDAFWWTGFGVWLGTLIAGIVTYNAGAQTVGGVLGAIWLFLCLWVAWRALLGLRAEVTSRRTRLVSVRAEPAAPSSAVANVVTVELSLSRRGSRTAKGRGTATVAVGAAYPEAARELPDQFARELARVTRRIRNRTAPIDLDVDRRAAAICWEALLAHGVARVERPPQVPFRFRRVVEAPLASGTKWRRVSSVLCVVGNPLHEAMARAAWGKVRRRRLALTVAPAARLHSSTWPTIHVVHLVANAIETASAVRLELGEPLATPGSRGELLRADELPMRFPAAALYVLQARPLHAAARTHAEREQAALLRDFAAELAALGAPAVVTVPPFAEATAIEVLARVGEGLRRRSAKRGLPRAVRSVRRKVLKDATGLELEAAFDLCVYTNDARALAGARASHPPAPSGPAPGPPGRLVP